MGLYRNMLLTFESVRGEWIWTLGDDDSLVPLGEIQTFSEILITLCRDRELCEKMGAAGKKSVRRFSLSNVMQGYSILLEDLVGK